MVSFSHYFLTALVGEQFGLSNFRFLHPLLNGCQALWKMAWGDFQWWCVYSWVSKCAIKGFLFSDNRPFSPNTCLVVFPSLTDNSWEQPEAVGMGSTWGASGHSLLSTTQWGLTDLNALWFVGSGPLWLLLFVLFSFLIGSDCMVMAVAFLPWSVLRMIASSEPVSAVWLSSIS